MKNVSKFGLDLVIDSIRSKEIDLGEAVLFSEVLYKLYTQTEGFTFEEKEYLRMETRFAIYTESNTLNNYLKKDGLYQHTDCIQETAMNIKTLAQLLEELGE